MDIYDLNFKKILVILNNKIMKSNFVNFLNLNEIEADFNFVDSYTEGAKLMLEEKFNQFDYVILNKQFSNKKLKDFLEFASEQVSEDVILDYNDLLAE
jgi:hypothetical protein